MRRLAPEALRLALAEYETISQSEPFFDFEDMDPEAVHILAAAARVLLGLTVNRFEVIDHTSNGQGRVLSKWESFDFQPFFDVQDGGRTLKVFLSSQEPLN